MSNWQVVKRYEYISFQEYFEAHANESNWKGDFLQFAKSLWSRFPSVDFQNKQQMTGTRKKDCVSKCGQQLLVSFRACNLCSFSWFGHRRSSNLYDAQLFSHPTNLAELHRSNASCFCLQTLTRVTSLRDEKRANQGNQQTLVYICSRQFSSSADETPCHLTEASIRLVHMLSNTSKMASASPPLCLPLRSKAAHQTADKKERKKKTWIKSEYFIHSCQRKARRVTLGTAGMCCCFDSEPGTHCLFNEHTGSQEQVAFDLCYSSIGRTVPAHHQNLALLLSVAAVGLKIEGIYFFLLMQVNVMSSINCWIDCLYSQSEVTRRF